MYLSLHKITCTYLHLPALTYTYLHLPTLTWTNQNLLKFTWIYLSLPGFTWIYLNLPEFTWIYLNGFTWVHLGWSGWIWETWNKMGHIGGTRKPQTNTQTDTEFLRCTEILSDLIKTGLGKPMMLHTRLLFVNSAERIYIERCSSAAFHQNSHRVKQNSCKHGEMLLSHGYRSRLDLAVALLGRLLL